MATTFDTLTDVGKEQRLLFLYDRNYFIPIAYATAASISFSGDTIDVSNKTDGDWTTVMQGKKSAEVSIDALVSHKSRGSESALQEAYNDGENLRFLYAYFKVTVGDDGLTTEVEIDPSKPMYYGQMQISSLELTSDNGDVCKFSCSGASQGTVVSAVGVVLGEDVEIKQQSVVVNKGQESTLIYDTVNKVFGLVVGLNTYNNWTGYACCAKSDVFDDEGEVRTDVAFIDVDDEGILRWDAEAGELIAI